MKKLFIASFIALTALGAQAQIYGELGSMSVTAKEDVPGGNIKASPLSVRAILGYELNPNLAVEGMWASGVKKAAIEGDGQKDSSRTWKLDNAMGLYVKPKTKVSNAIEIFGRVGFSRVKGSGDTVGFGSGSDSDSGFSYGAGLSYALAPTTMLNADYMQYLNKYGFELKGFTFGLGFKF